VNAAASVIPPIIIEQRQPGYPMEALPRRLSGDVAVTVEIDASGTVTGTSLSRGVAPELDSAAMATAGLWRFEPARRDGVPIPSRVQLVFHFEPPAAPPPAPTPPQRGAAPIPQAVPIEEQPAAAAPEAKSERPPAALDVSVVGRRPPPSRGASDFQLHVDQLVEVPRTNAAELLKLAPGILLTNEGGEGHADQVFMRGFDAREGQDIEFTVGGVPINESGNLHGNGYADTNFIIPELVESLRVLEGPYDPRQGNYAVAGSADYQLGLADRGLQLRYTLGTFGTQRILGLWGPPGESTHTFGAASISKTDGFGQNRDAQAGSAMTQYEGRLGTSGTYRLTGQAYATHFHSAGVIREDDYQSGRIGFYDSYDLSSFARQRAPEGGDASRYSIAADLETRTGDTTFGEQVFLIKRDMRLLENFTGFLLDVQEPLQTPHDQRGDMLDLNVHELTIGSRGWARFAGAWLGQRQELELGYFARGDDAAGTQERIEAATGAPYKVEANLDSQIGDIGLYGDANLHLGRWLTLRGGGRAELLTYDVHDNCAAQTVAHPSPTNPPIDQSCLTQQDLGRPREPDQVTSTSGVTVLPRGSLIAGPLRGLSLSLSWGKGVRSVDPSYVISDVSAPFASITAYEAGAAFTGHLRATTVVARSVVFRTLVDKDLIFDQTEGRNVIGVGTTRTGWLGALRWAGPFFDESANLTLVHATYNDNGTAVPYVPNVVFRSDTALFHDLPRAFLGRVARLSFGAGVTYIGPRALPYGEVSGDIFTIDAAATLTWGAYQVRLASTNLLNTQYRLGEYNYASDFHSQPQPTLVPDRTFTAGAPRAVLATFAITFGGP
jgi:TonB family protein